MTKRITLNEDDLEIIKYALIGLHKDSIINPKVCPQNALASAQRMYQIMAKLGIACTKDEL